MAEAVLLDGLHAGRTARWTSPFAMRVWRLRLERTAGLWREQFPDRIYSEVLTDDSRAGEHAACSRPKALEPRRQQSLYGGRQHRPDLALGLLARARPPVAQGRADCRPPSRGAVLEWTANGLIASQAIPGAPSLRRRRVA